MSIAIGTRVRFNYPEMFTTLPEYTARAGDIVTVVQLLESDCEDDPIYKIRADDGWEGSAWESELEEEK